MHSPMGTMRADGEIFGIGLSKTGTMSLHEALNLLRLRVLIAGVSLPQDTDFDAATHEMIAVHFEDLDRVYPGSRFIYTVRDKDEWLRSIRRHWRVHREEGVANRATLKSLYGLQDWRFDQKTFSRAYDRLHERVMAYFAGRDDLLVMNICDGDGWGMLCPFLGLPLQISRSFAPTPASDRHPIICCVLICCVRASWSGASHGGHRLYPS